MNCGATRPDEFGTPPAGGVPPCPNCGSTAIVLTIKARTTIRIGADASVGLGVDHTRDWQRLWQGIEGASVLAPQAGPISEPVIHKARAELEAFYGECLNLRDHLANDPSVPLTKEQINAAVDADPILALVADLANIGKHAVLTKRLHSGDRPSIVGEGGVPDSAGGWVLTVDIEHDGNTLDGVTVAEEAVVAWKAQLTAWGLLARPTGERFRADVRIGGDDAGTSLS